MALCCEPLIWGWICAAGRKVSKSSSFLGKRCSPSSCHCPAGSGQHPRTHSMAQNWNSILLAQTYQKSLPGFLLILLLSNIKKKKKQFQQNWKSQWGNISFTILLFTVLIEFKCFVLFCFFSFSQLFNAGLNHWFPFRYTGILHG